MSTCAHKDQFKVSTYCTYIVLTHPTKLHQLDITMVTMDVLDDSLLNDDVNAIISLLYFQQSNDCLRVAALVVKFKSSYSSIPFYFP